MHTYRKLENPAVEYNSVHDLNFLGAFWVIFEAQPAYWHWYAEHSLSF